MTDAIRPRSQSDYKNNQLKKRKQALKVLIYMYIYMLHSNLGQCCKMCYADSRPPPTPVLDCKVITKVALITINSLCFANLI